MRTIIEAEMHEAKFGNVSARAMAMVIPKYGPFESSIMPSRYLRENSNFELTEHENIKKRKRKN